MRAWRVEVVRKGKGLEQLQPTSPEPSHLTNGCKWTVEASRGGVNAAAQCVVLNNNILVPPDSGELLLIAADPVQGKVISRLKVSTATWCNPVYVGERTFFCATSTN